MTMLHSKKKKINNKMSCAELGMAMCLLLGVFLPFQPSSGVFVSAKLATPNLGYVKGDEEGSKGPNSGIFLRKLLPHDRALSPKKSKKSKKSGEVMKLDNDDEICGAELSDGMTYVIELTDETIKTIDCSESGPIRLASSTLDCGGMEITGNGNEDGITITGKGSKLRNCVLKGFNNGVKVEDAKDAKIYDTNIIDSTDDGINIGEESSVEVKGGLIKNSGDDGIEVTGGRLVVKDTKVEDNDFGIYVRGSGSAKIYDTSITDSSKDGINIGEESSAEVKGGLIKNSAGDGIEASGGKLIVKDTKVEDNEYGIFVTGSGSTEIYDTSITDSEKDGILIEGESSVEVEIALIKNSGGIGIDVEDGELMIKDSTIEGSTFNGIDTEGNTGSVKIDNTVIV